MEEKSYQGAAPLQKEAEGQSCPPSPAKGSAWGLLPIGVFLVVYIGSGVVFQSFYAMPAIVGCGGVEYKVPAPFNAQELAQLHESAKTMKEVIETLDL